MPLTETDARALMAAVLEAHGEDYDQIGRLLTVLRQRWGVDWVGALTTEAHAFQRFVDGGLSVAWWLAEVDRRSS